jgi:DUF2934 family protein
VKPTKSKKTSQKPAPRTKPAPQSPLLSERLHEQIAKRAYEVYERRICQGALDDWLQAEQEILEQKKTRSADMPHRGGYATEEQD